MKNITDTFREVYLPIKALLVYQSAIEESKTYLESFDCDLSGRLINAHPLSLKEVQQLSALLSYSSDNQKTYLQSTALLSAQLLYLNADQDCTIWYTPAAAHDLYFIPSLNIPNGKAAVPPLLWKATSEELHLFALKTSERPGDTTVLYHAPFLNMYANGKVCMGTVDIDFTDCHNLTAFTNRWQQYYFNSQFSHAISTHKACRIPLPRLWTDLIRSHKPFPIKSLIATDKLLKDILP